MALAALLLAGCQRQVHFQELPDFEIPESATPAPVVEEPLPGGTLRVALGPTTEDLNPLTNQDRDTRNVLELVYEPLVELDEAQQPAPCLAESWSADAENHTVTFALRQGVTFHDGSALSAQDVVYTGQQLLNQYEIQREEGQPVASLPFTAVEATEDGQVRFTMRNASYGLLCAMNFPILKEGGADASPMGTGPFQLERVEPDEGLSLVRFDGWWRKAPILERVQATCFKSPEAALEAYTQGELDVVLTDSITYGRYQRDSLSSVHSAMTQYYECLMPNLSSAMVGDEQVRRAILEGIDRKQLSANAYLGNATAVDAPVPPDSFAYRAPENAPPYDPEAAVARLEQAGWRDEDGDGIRERVIDGQTVPLSVTLVTNKNGSPGRADAAKAIEDMLEKIGVMVEVETLGENSLSYRIEQKKYDLALVGFYLSRVPDVTGLLHSQGLQNPNGAKSEAVDGILGNLAQASDVQTYVDAMGALQAQVAQELPLMSLYMRSFCLVVRDPLRLGETQPREMEAYRGVSSWYFVGQPSA